MSFDVTTLDGRHAGRSQFSYYITSSGRDMSANIVEFQRWRNWAQDTWGHGCERDWAFALGRSKEFTPPLWGWVTDEQKVRYQPRLYLKSARELTLFKLKWM